MTIPAPLWHYTCECGHGSLQRDPVVRPTRDLIAPATLARLTPNLYALTMFAWFTDLGEPDAAALGLTQHRIGCARTRYRWLVISAIPRPVPYLSMRGHLPTWTRAALENEPGVLLRHWYVSRTAMPVSFDPPRPEARQHADRIVAR